MKQPLLSKIATLIVMLLLFEAQSKAQSTKQSKIDSLLHRSSVNSNNADESQQSIFFEIAGPSGIYAFNYEKRFGANPGSFGVRAGIGYLPLTKVGGNQESFTFITVPVGVNYLLGGNEKYLELGLGATYATAETDQVINTSGNDTVTGTTFWFNTVVGFRYQSDDGGFQFRIGASPLFGKTSHPANAYLSFGYSFN
jgi:hypothetical protein